MTTSKLRRPRKKEIRARAETAGAQTEGDFALFSRLAMAHHDLAVVAEIWDKHVPLPTLDMLWQHEILLERGRFFREEMLPEGFEYGEPKQCYGNSFDLVQERPDLAYCEGYLATPIGQDEWLDVKHAWSVTSDGKVIDVTWEGVAGMSYFGFIYTRDEIVRLGGGDRLPLIDEMVTPRLNAAATGGIGGRMRRRRAIRRREPSTTVAAPNYDQAKVDDATLALMWLTMWQDGMGTHSWKGHDWAALDRLHAKGYIGIPGGMAKSIAITESGRIKAEELFRQLFAKSP